MYGWDKEFCWPLMEQHLQESQPFVLEADVVINYLLAEAKRDLDLLLIWKRWCPLRKRKSIDLLVDVYVGGENCIGDTVLDWMEYVELLLEENVRVKCGWRWGVTDIDIIWKLFYSLCNNSVKKSGIM